MSSNKVGASSKEISNELEKLDFAKLIADMVDYTLFRIRIKNDSEAEDLVSDLLEKVIDQSRKWYKENSFREFLFSSLKSDIYNYNRKLKGSLPDLDQDNPESQKVIVVDSKFDINDKIKVLEIFKSHIPPPNYIEEMIFECWLDGMIKPKEIRDYLEEFSAKEIKNGIERLKTKLSAVKEYLIQLYHG